MKLKSFTMQLYPGKAQEYEKRHHALWSDLKSLIKSHGIHDYSIHLDEQTHQLFAVCNVESEEKLRELPNHPIMKKWWTYMSDIMETNEDHSPVERPLKTVFELEKK